MEWINFRKFYWLWYAEISFERGTKRRSFHYNVFINKSAILMVFLPPRTCYKSTWRLCRWHLYVRWRWLYVRGRIRRWYWFWRHSEMRCIRRSFKTLYIRRTDAQISLHTLLIKYYNDLLGRQTSERGRDEITYFYVGEVFFLENRHT